VTAENAEEILAKHGHGPPNYGLLPHVAALRDELKDEVINPLVNGNPGFDFETVFANLDGENDDSTGTTMDDVFDRRAVLKMTGHVLALIFDWLLQVNLKGDRLVKAVGVRACVAAWVIDPEHFDGASLTKVAKNLGYSSQSAMSPEAAEFSRRFGITNKFQTHCPNKEKNNATPPATN
jgi:AraC-like DNA-binding protein